MLSFKSITLGILALLMHSNSFCMETLFQPLSRNDSGFPGLNVTSDSLVRHQHLNLSAFGDMSQQQQSKNRRRSFGSIISSNSSDSPIQATEALDTQQLPSNIGVFSKSKIRRDQAPIEDHWNITPLDDDMLFAGVFDGHGDGLTNYMNVHFEGVQPGAVAYFAAQNICSTILTHTTSHNLKDSIILGTQETDRAIAAEPYLKDQGSTAIFSFIGKECISIANLGDSRCVIYDQTGAVVFATQDHTLKNPREPERVKSEGGVIENHISDTDDTLVVPRIGGILMASRGLGDYGYADHQYYKDLVDDYNVRLNIDDDNEHQINEYKRMFVGIKLPGISNVPDVTRLARNETHAFMVLGSDGLFDIITNEELGAKIFHKIVTEGEPAQQAAREIVIEKTKGESPKDDLTAILIDLRTQSTY